MNKENNITINFTSIIDYIRDKDLEIDRYRMLYLKNKNNIEKAINLIQERKVAGYIKAIDFNDLLDILRGEDNE